MGGGHGFPWRRLAVAGSAWLCAVLAWGQQAEVPLAEIGVVVAEKLQDARANDLDPAVRTRVAEAERLIAAGQYERAIAELDVALEQAAEPGFVALQLLATANEKLGRAGLARLAAERAAELRPNDAGARRLAGRLHRAQGRLSQAIQAYRAATQAEEPREGDPQVTLAWFDLGSTLVEAGYKLAAAEALAQFDTRVFGTYPEHQEADEVAVLLKRSPNGALEQRLGLWRTLGRPDEMARVAEDASRREPEDLHLLCLYVRALLDAGRAKPAFEACRERVEALRAAEGAVPSGLLALGVEAAEAAGDLDVWVASLRAGSADDAASRALLREIAQQLDAAQKPTIAVRLWEALAVADPGSADVAWALANAYKDAGQLAAALESLIRFVRERGADAEIPSGQLAAWMRNFERTDEFLRLVEEWTARDGVDFATYTVLGVTAAAAEQAELAERLFAAALEDRPDFALAHVAWGRMLLEEYRWEAALEHAQAALRTDGRLPAAHLLAAEAYAGLNQYKEAEAAYQAAMEARPEDVTPVLALARLHRQAGDLLAAQRYLQQTTTMDPTQGVALEELIDTYLEAGKVEIARATLAEAEKSAAVPRDSLRRIQTTLRYAARPMSEEHVAALREQFVAHPDDAETGLKLAAGLFLHYRLDEAVEVVREVRPLRPRDERGAYLEARIHMRRLDNDAAIEVLRELVQRYPRRQEALRLLADAQLAAFEMDAARETLQRLLELDLKPDERTEVRVGLLGTHHEVREFDAALALLDAWIAEAPEHDTWPRAKLRVLLTARRENEAVAYARSRLDPAEQQFMELRGRYTALAEKLSAVPENAELQAQLKQVERELGTLLEQLQERRADYVDTCMDAERYGTVEREIRAWLSSEADQAPLQQWLVEALLRAEKYEAALAELAKLAPQTPGEVIQVLLWRARARAGTGALDDAVEDLLGLLREGFMQESAAARASVRQEILTLLLTPNEQRPREQQVERALELCESWLEGVAQGDELGRLEVLTLKLSVLTAVGRLEAQIPIMQELLEVQPHDPGLNNDLGYTWADRGENLDEARRMVRKALAAEPLNGAFLDSLGWVHYKRGEFGEAAKYLERATRLRDGQDPVVYDHFGDAAYRLGDREAARRHWEEAARLLEQREDADLLEVFVRLKAALRAKLVALASSEPPVVAPTAAEQGAEEQATAAEGVAP